MNKTCSFPYKVTEQENEMKSSVKFFKPLSWVVLGLFVASCQSVGPTGRAVERTEPEKSAEELYAQEAAPTSARKLVGKFGAELSVRNCKLTIPGGALTEDTYVEIRLAEDAPEGFVKETAYGIFPEGITFKQPALLRLHYFDDDLEPGQTEEKIIAVEDVGGQWFDVPGFSIDVYNNIVSFQIIKAGTYALKVGEAREPLVNIPPIANLSFELISKEEAQKEGKPERAETQETGQSAENLEAGSRETTPPIGPKQEEREVSLGSAEETPLELNAKVPEPKPDKSSQPLKAQPEAQEDNGTYVLPEGSRKSFKIEKEKPTEKETPKLTKEFVVRYSAEGSRDPDGSVIRFMWDFNADCVFDEIGGKKVVEQRYLDYGKVLTLLRVEDNHIPADWDIAYVVVELAQPTETPRLPLKASAVLFPPRIAIGGKLLAGASVTGGTPPYKFSWEFSDGQSSVEQALLVSPISRGKFTARLVVTDSAGLEVKKELSSEVVTDYKASAKGLRLRISPDTVSLPSPGKVDFSLSIQGGTAPYKVLVSSTDGKSMLTEGTSFSLSFENAGYSIVSVAVTDALGQGAKLFVPVKVGVEEAGQGVYRGAKVPDVNAQIAKDGLTVKLTAVGIPGKAEVKWDFGDGTSQSGAEVKKKYAKASVYSVRLSVDDGFRLLTRELQIPVGGGKLCAAINMPRRLIGTLPFNLMPSAYVSGGKPPLFYRWNIGDLFSDDEHPRFVLESPGTYQLQLTVTDANGNSYDTEPVRVEVYRRPPDYRYPIAFLSDEEMNGEEATRLKLVEFDGNSPFVFPLLSVPRKVFLAPGGESLGIVSDDGLAVFHLPSLRELASFTPSNGELEKLFLTRGTERFYFNLQRIAGTSSVQGFLFSEGTGFLPIAEAGSRILSVSVNGDKVLLSEPQGTGKLIEVDPFSGAIRSIHAFNQRISEGVIVKEGSSVVVLTTAGKVSIIDVLSEEQAQIGENASSNLSSSLSGDVIAWNNEDGDIILLQATGEEKGKAFPVNLTELTGLKSQNWQISPDGKLLLMYVEGEKKPGLYLLELRENLKDAAEKLKAHFIAKASPEFSFTSSLKPFDVLLPEEGT